MSQEGKPSETRFKVEERYEFATLVRCSPVTGRTHQIRVHTQYAGHPIAFDDRYGDREFDKQLSGTGLNRLFLHAAALKFTHPGSGEVMRVEGAAGQPAEALFTGATEEQISATAESVPPFFLPQPNSGL